MSTVSAFKRLRLEDLKLEASLGHIAIPCLKGEKRKKEKKKKLGLMPGGGGARL